MINSLHSFQALGLTHKTLTVFGAPPRADAGQLVFVLAGPKSDVARVKPYCNGVMGHAEIDFSDQPQGIASLLKIIGNTFVLNMVEALSEGHTFAEKSGLGTQNLHTFIETMFPGIFTAYSGRLMAGDYYRREEVCPNYYLASYEPGIMYTQPLFGVDLARKDAKHALHLAEVSGSKLKDMEVVDAHLAAVQKHMGSRGDIAGIYGAVRQESGLKFELD